jgi:hypothetical protein
MLSSFISTRSTGAILLCTLTICLAALGRLWTDWKSQALHAELQNPGRESAEDFYY